MFCPKCKCEYIKGFSTCADCNASLVNILPIEEKEKPSKVKMEYSEYELILSTYKYTDIAQIRSVFDSEGIRYYIQGEDMGIAPGGLPARVLVAKEGVEEAKELLKNFNLI